MAQSAGLGPFRGLLLLLFHLAACAACLLGAGVVLLIMGGLLVADLLVGALAGDLRSRMKRSRW